MNLIKRTNDKLATRIKAGLHPWDSLLSLLLQRSIEMTDCDVTMVWFIPKGKEHSYAEQPGILIGRVDSLIGFSTRVFTIHAFGEIVDEGSIQEAHALWSHSGYLEIPGKDGITFASGKLDLEGLTYELARAISIVELFHGVDRDSEVSAIGDPRLEELLAERADSKFLAVAK